MEKQHERFAMNHDENFLLLFYKSIMSAKFIKSTKKAARGIAMAALCN